MNKPLCIYHDRCLDGFGAAWAVHHAFGAGNVDFVPGVYGAAPPDVTGRDVIIVDFSYKPEPMIDLIAAAKSVIILDHHATAGPLLFEIFSRGIAKGLFSDGKSGAMLAWEWFNPSKAAPALIQHIQDGDLWLFWMEDTKAVQGALRTYPYDFSIWDELMDVNIGTLVQQGRAIERKNQKDLAELLGVTRRRMVIGGFEVPVANLPYLMASDAGNEMAKGEPFAATYMDQTHGRVFSLRSTAEGMDVGQIALAYGGGGHMHASGFTMSIGWEGDAPMVGAAGSGLETTAS